MSEKLAGSTPTEPQTGATEVGDWVGVLPGDKSSSTRQHRIHQGRWRTDVAHWPAGQPQNDVRVRARYATLPNWLAETHDGRDVSQTAINLMSDEALAYTHERLKALKLIDGKAEPDRLWRNLLSSQPLAFSLAGHLHRRQDEAAVLLSSLTGLRISKLGRLEAGDGVGKGHRLDGIDAEWFPPRGEHTQDMSGSDIASCVELQDGQRVLVTVEVKYTDTFSAAPVTWSPRYEPHLAALGLEPASLSALVDAGCSQVLRQVMITDSVRRQGVAPDAGSGAQVHSGLAVVLAREDDQTARRVVDALDQAVGAIIPVRFWSHRQVFDEARKIDTLSSWADRLAGRYLIAVP